ncbi:HCLS1-associated protein X-1 [Anomaloglossus baeobatrachus]|uniref:HCLS1-associated protein X-1 n=1 Tax=Anomaloglossus baeobatrachus TaxID=238106 RepID=UPI003F4FD2B3
MSVFDLFRRFFHPPGMRDPFFGGMMEDEEDEDDFSQLPPGFGRSSLHDPFGFEDIFRDFNELFTDFGSIIQDVPQLPGAEPSLRTPGGRGTGSLRDFMLKFPDSHLPRLQPRWPTEGQEDNIGTSHSGETKQDKILDLEVSSRGLDSILRPEEQSPSSSSSSYFRSVSVSRVMRPDGTVEERRTVRDSDGNANTTVTVTSGDQVISDPPRGALTDEMDSALGLHRSLPGLSDSQTILTRILQRWFSN